MSTLKNRIQAVTDRPNSFREGEATARAALAVVSDLLSLDTFEPGMADLLCRLVGTVDDMKAYNGFVRSQELDELALYRPLESSRAATQYVLKLGRAMNYELDRRGNQAIGYHYATTPPTEQADHPRSAPLFTIGMPCISIQREADFATEDYEVRIYVSIPYATVVNGELNVHHAAATQTLRFIDAPDGNTAYYRNPEFSRLSRDADADALAQAALTDTLDTLADTECSAWASARRTLELMAETREAAMPDGGRAELSDMGTFTIKYPDSQQAHETSRFGILWILADEQGRALERLVAKGEYAVA